MQLTDLTLAEQGELLRTGQCSSRDIVEAHLARIEALDAKLHAFVEVYAREARTLADAADKARAAGLPLGPLHGLPIALKDLCDIAGRVGTVGSRMWASRVAEATSATVERLLGAGMIPLGKTHMVEFAFGAWGTNAMMGTPWNPWDLERHRVPGGSSSGTAVAVAAGLAPVGIGSDTGGSEPARNRHARVYRPELPAIGLPAGRLHRQPPVPARPGKACHLRQRLLERQHCL